MFPGLSWHEFVIIGVVAILLFGKRLPEVAKKLGGSYREFRRGLSEFQGQVDLTDLGRSTTYSPPPTYSAPQHSADDYDEPTAPRFEPPPAEPTPPQDSHTAG